MPRSSPRKRTVVNYNEDGEPKKRQSSPNVTESKVTQVKPQSSGTVKSSTKRKADVALPPPEATEPVTEAPKATKKQKTKSKDENAMPLASRTAVASLKKAKYIGAHVSGAGGVQNSITNALHIGANSFALFLKSQRKWDNPALTTEAKDLFLSNCKSHSYNQAEHALPHGSYLVNLAQLDVTKATQAYNGFLDDLKRCEQLGIKLYNFHPGSTGGENRAGAIGRIAKQLNKSHAATKTVMTVLENMAGGGNVIGSTWEDLRDVIALVDDKERVGVCIDTCHAFAAGYDLRTPEAYEQTMANFDKVVGKKYLKAFHLNDSKAPYKSHRDLHANIGTGFLGLSAFHSIMNDPTLCNMPMVLETPIDHKDVNGKTVEDKQVWADEIKLLESLIGMDDASDEFQQMSDELQSKGTSERKKIQDQVDKKAVKDGKKGSRAGGKKGKKQQGSDDESD